MGINNSVDYSARIAELEAELNGCDEQNARGFNPSVPSFENGYNMLQNALTCQGRYNAAGIINDRGFVSNPIKCTFKPNYQVYKSVSDRTEDIMAQKQTATFLQPLEEDENELIKTDDGVMTRHYQMVDRARKYCKENQYDVENQYLNIDGTFNGVLMNTENGEIALDLPHLRTDDRYCEFTINDILTPCAQNPGVLSHTTSKENAQKIKEFGFDQRFSKSNKGSADGIYFLNGKDNKFGSDEDSEVVNAYYNGKFCEADLDQLEDLAKRLKSAHEEDFEDLEDTEGRLSKVFLQNLMAEIGYDGVIVTKRDGSKEVIAFDPSKIVLA